MVGWGVENLEFLPKVEKKYNHKLFPSSVQQNWLRCSRWWLFQRLQGLPVIKEGEEGEIL